MDLGKMLLEAMRAHAGPNGFFVFETPPSHFTPNHSQINGTVDFNAAAKTFLASVKDARTEDVDREHSERR